MAALMGHRGLMLRGRDPDVISWIDCNNADGPIDAVDGVTWTPNNLTYIGMTVNAYAGSHAIRSKGGSAGYYTRAIDIAGADDFTLEGRVLFEAGTVQINNHIAFVRMGPLYLTSKWPSSTTFTWNITNGTNVTHAGTFGVSGWRHFALVRQSGTLRLYINGTLQVTHPSSSVQAVGFIYLGNPIAQNDPRYSQVRIDEVRLIKRALYTADFTPTEPPLPL